MVVLLLLQLLLLLLLVLQLALLLLLRLLVLLLLLLLLLPPRMLLLTQLLLLLLLLLLLQHLLLLVLIFIYLFVCFVCLCVYIFIKHCNYRFGCTAESTWNLQTLSNEACDFPFIHHINTKSVFLLLDCTFYIFYIFFSLLFFPFLSLKLNCDLQFFNFWVSGIHWRRVNIISYDRFVAKCSSWPQTMTTRLFYFLIKNSSRYYKRARGLCRHITKSS